MVIRELVRLTNTYLAGEQLVYEKLVPFYDSVVDDINSRLNTTFPSFSSLGVTSSEANTAVYDYFPDRYLRSVVALGAAHKFYMMDEEGVIFDTSYEQEYERNLYYMTRDYIDQIPLIYQSDSTGGVIVHEDDYLSGVFPLAGCGCGPGVGPGPGPIPTPPPMQPNITVSNRDPRQSDGRDGDVWIKY